MTEGPDIFIPLGVRGLGQGMARLLNDYTLIMGKTTEPGNTAPHYVRDLMGDHCLPSFYVHRENFINGVREEDPYHVGKVLDEIHMALRSLWRTNIKFDPKTLPPKAKEILSGQDVKEFTALRRRITEQTSKGDADKALTDRLQELGIKINAELDEAFGSVGEIHLTVGNGDNGVPIILDNIDMEPQNLTKEETFRSSPAPLAGVIWGLSLAGSKLVGRDLGPIIQYYTGAQRSFTETEEQIFGFINDLLPGNQTVYDLLEFDGQALGETIQEETPHLRMADTVARSMYRFGSAITEDNLTGFGYALSMANVQTRGNAIANPYAARDTAALIYATAHGLSSAMPELAAEGDSRLLQQMVNGSSDFKYSLDNVKERLLTLADEIGRQKQTDRTAQLKDQQYVLQSKEEVHKAITSKPGNIDLLRAASSRTEALTKTGYGKVSNVSVGLRLISRSLLPDEKIIRSTPTRQIDFFGRNQPSR